MTTPVIAVCTPVANMMHPLFVKSLRDLDLPRPYHVFDVRGVHPIDHARNEIAKAALAAEPHATHLLWIDDDMVFAPQSAERLLAHDLPIVGGLCFNRRHPYMPILLRRWPAGANMGTDEYGYVYEDEARVEIEAKGTPLFEVDATGAAFLLVKREVFETVGEKPFANIRGGEDVSFCRRAQEAGFKVFVDTSVGIGHVGEVVVDFEFARRNRKLRFNPWTPHAGVTQAGLRILGDEQTPDGVMHRARYAWAVDVLAAAQRAAPARHQIDRASFRVLDFGCGTGHGTKTLRTAGFNALGYDPDEKAIAYGDTKLGLSGYLSTRGPWLSDDPTLYDAITAFEVIEHLPAAPGRTLEALLRHAPIVVGSVPYREPVGANPHHLHAMLEPGDLAGAGNVVFFAQRWDGTITLVEPGVEPKRDEFPILLFVARRS